MAITDVGIATFHARAEAWECDHNQHWNVRQYMRVFQQARFVAADMAGDTLGQGPFTQHTRYHRELLQAAPVTIRSAIVADGPFAGALVHILTSEGRLSATALDHPGVGQSALPRVAATDVALALPRGVTGGPHDRTQCHPLRGSKVIEHGFTQPRDMDHTGALGIDHFMGRIAAGSNDLLSRLGYSPAFIRESGVTRMGVETKITLYAPIPIATRLQSTVGIRHLGTKNVVLRHEFMRVDGTPAASVDQSLVAVDLTTRRATELPQGFKEMAQSALDASGHQKQG